MMIGDRGRVWHERCGRGREQRVQESNPKDSEQLHMAYI